MKHTAKLVVRTYELDAYNHVNNATYLNYLEYGRMEFLRAIGFDYNALIDAGYYLYVTHIDIHYRMSSRLFDELSIDVEPVKLGRVSGFLGKRYATSAGSFARRPRCRGGALTTTESLLKSPMSLC